MRVMFLHLFDLDLTGGSGTHLRAVCRELVERGHQVDVVSARRPDRFGCTTHALPFPFTLTFGPEIRPGERGLDDLGLDEFDNLADAAVDSILQRYGAGPVPDLIVANHLSLLTVVAATLSRLWKVPYRAISFGTDTDLLRRVPGYAEPLAASTAGADQIFAISHFVAREVRSLLPVTDVEVLGAAADGRLFFPGPDRAAPPRVVTYVGRLTTEKGLHVLLAAVRRTTCVDRVDILGEGPLADTLRAELAADPPPAPIVLNGPVPHAELRHRLVDSAAVVVPSIWQEPLALVVAEALACGVPVVATAVGGIAEMVRDGINGLVVPPADAEALARALDRATGEPVFADELRRRCREDARRVPGYADVARRLVAGVAGHPS